ncbi:hypothetical protein RDI58_026492 [Solanum bulbocastanum]|uniref:DUF4283 domain-containing protein n=1 Tax=Solanum bulbocastanum TaxID=147425 RepID=A0AAN8T1H1_SOLBU
MVASPSPQPMAVRETNVNPNTGRTYASSISRNQQSSEKSLKLVILLHGEPTVVFDSKDIETFITEDNLKYTLITKFSHGRPELPYLRKILPQQLGFKGDCNIGLLESRHVLLRFTLKEDYIAIFSETSRSIKFAGTVIPFRIQKWTPSFSPREETSIAMLDNLLMWINDNLILQGLEIGEKDDEEIVKDLDVGVEKSGVQDQNLVPQNSGQRQGKAMLDDYSSGNQVLSLIPQTGESSRQSCNSVDHVGVEEQLVVHSNQQNKKSKDAQFAQKINEVIKFDAQLENLAIDEKEKIAKSKRVQSNGPKDIVCTNPFEALGVEKELELIDSNPLKEKTLVRADPNSNIQSVSTPIGVCSMLTEKDDNVMSPAVAKAIQESRLPCYSSPIQRSSHPWSH